MTTSADECLRELRALVVELEARGSDVVDDEMLDRVERTVAFAVAWLAPSREQAAPAIEAAIAGAAGQPRATRADDLLLTVELLAHGLESVHGTA